MTKYITSFRNVYLSIFIAFFTLKGSSQNNLSNAVDASKRDIPLYGFNGANGSNKRFVDSVATLQPNILRYPSGSVANYWDWQSGKVENPKVFINERIQKKQTNSYKINTSNSSSTLDGLKILVDKTHCDILFVLNMVTRDLTDQINMLKHAESLGIPIKWVELGNEFYSPESPSWSKYKTINDYAQACNKWIDALKKQFPNVKVAIVGGNTAINEFTKNWNNILLRDASNADAITAHSYINFNTVIDNDGISYRKLNKQIEQNLDVRGFNKVSNKDIWVTEYNIQWLTKNKSLTKIINPGKTLPFTWGHALATILFTSKLSSLPNVKMLINYSLANTPVFSAIDTKDSSFKKNPNGIAMQLWLTVVHNMKIMQKVNFRALNNQNVFKDYEVSGWKFSNDNETRFLITNYLNTTSTFNINDASKNRKWEYTIYYSNKDKVIKGNEDIKISTGSISNRSEKITLPRYSICVIK